LALAPGDRLGSYEITAQIGEGGMGQVYRATDPKLKRQVAIKVLPPSLAGDPDRLARFQREAQILAALNHPNIAAIYGSEDAADGRQALVLELVEGPTLADRLEQGPLPLDEALAIARQLVDALEAAHEQGIIHRDLKPANIKVRPDGAVKVLDFGLAKLTDPSSAAPAGEMVTQSPTITSPALMTRMGMILGTAAYMSPEQAKGRPADKRSDVWAFGCVLYEMLTGKRVFGSNDVSETLAYVITREPQWTLLPAAAPPAVRRLLRRCLEKDRKKRLAEIADARLELDEATAHTPESEPEKTAAITRAPAGSCATGALKHWSGRSRRDRR
jgi:serine/threonine protein kinase